MLTDSEFAHMLMRNQAVYFSPAHPFTFASGIVSPIYCDNRLLLGAPADRTRIAETLREMVEDAPPASSTAAHGAATPRTAQAIVGTATAGIPWAALCADRLRLPVAYARATAKEHGAQKSIEGAALDGKRVIIVEDLISTGGSALRVARQCEAHGATVLQICALFSYEFAISAIRDAPFPITAIGTLSTLLAVAVQQGCIDEGERQQIIDWQQQR